MFQHLKAPTDGGYQHCGQMCVDGQHHTLHQCTLSSFLSTVCEQLDPASVGTSYCNAPLLTVFQN